jgi:hypothetical protein
MMIAMMMTTATARNIWTQDLPFPDATSCSDPQTFNAQKYHAMMEK